MQDQGEARRQRQQPPTRSIVDMLHQEMDPCKVGRVALQNTLLQPRYIHTEDSTAYFLARNVPLHI